MFRVTCPLLTLLAACEPSPAVPTEDVPASALRGCRQDSDCEKVSILLQRLLPGGRRQPQLRRGLQRAPSADL